MSPWFPGIRRCAGRTRRMCSACVGVSAVAPSGPLRSIQLPVQDVLMLKTVPSSCVPAVRRGAIKRFIHIDQARPQGIEPSVRPGSSTTRAPCRRV